MNYITSYFNLIEYSRCSIVSLSRSNTGLLVLQTGHKISFVISTTYHIPLSIQPYSLISGLQFLSIYQQQPSTQYHFNLNSNVFSRYSYRHFTMTCIITYRSQSISTQPVSNIASISTPRLLELGQISHRL